jgi:hypothetical protein
VIGAGFGRCGTTSLRAALQRLGFGPCYHMQTALTHCSHPAFWVRAKAGQPVDFRRFFRGSRAAVDWPACEFYRELMVLYPRAKVVLNVRDPEAWYDSTRETLFVIQRVLPWWFPRAARRMHDDIIWQGRFGGQFSDRKRAIAIYEAHVQDVRRRVPPERLLEFDVKQGWQPLCDFLGQPVPAQEPFPHHNDRAYFRRVIVGLRIAAWLVPALAVAACAGAAWWWSTG